MQLLAAALSALLTLAAPALADDDAPRPMQVSPLLGALVPTGHGRALFDDAVLGFVLGATARNYLSDFDGIGAERGSTRARDLAVFGSVGTRF